MTTQATEIPPRYQQDSMASRALRHALRQRIMAGMGISDKFGSLSTNKQAKIQGRLDNRYTRMQEGNVGLNEYGPQLRQQFLKNQKRLGGTPPVSNNPGGGGGGGSNGSGTPAPDPYVQINSNGQLDLPYNQQFAGYLLDAKDSMNQQLMQLQQQGQQQGLEYAQYKRDADINYQDVARQTLANAAAKGVAFSSGYGHHVAENATDYANYTGDLEQQNTLYNQGATNQRNLIETTFNDMLRRWSLDQAAQAAKDAGHLGYGKGTNNEKSIKQGTKGKPTPKPKPKNNGNHPRNFQRQPPKKKAPSGKKWVKVKNASGKVIRWKLVTVGGSNA